MSKPYEEILEGETYVRLAPDGRHEQICTRLHSRVSASLATITSTRLLPPRSIVQITPGTLVRPDLALVTATQGKLWLVAEIVSAYDHRLDTVSKKTIYEDINLPRLWMIDPRYDNLEVYHSGEWGLALKRIMAGREILTETLLPDFRMGLPELFVP